MTSDPLAQLVVDKKQLDRELLASTLVGLVSLDGETGEVRFTSETVRLSKKLQILLLLLGRKAAYALGLVPDEAIPPGEMEHVLGMGGGSLRGQLFNLKKDRLVASQSGRYTIPHYGVEAVKDMISEARKG